MLGETGLFVDRRVCFWLSAVYYNKMLKEGLEESIAEVLANSVGKEVMDEMDDVEDIVYFQFN